MGAQAVAITEPRVLEAVLADRSVEPVVLSVGAPVPPDLATWIARIRAAGRPLTVEVEGSEPGEPTDGHQIGLVTVLLAAGVQPGEIVGVDAQRVARVAEVLARWDEGGAP